MAITEKVILALPRSLVHFSFVDLFIFSLGFYIMVTKVTQTTHSLQPALVTKFPHNIGY
jgi:hypothetical protein